MNSQRFPPALVLWIFMASGGLTTAQDLIFPHFVAGGTGEGRSSTRWIFRNESSKPLAASLGFRDPEGNPLGLWIGGASRETVEFELLPWGTGQVETDRLQPLASGSAEVKILEGMRGKLQGAEIIETFEHFVSVNPAPPRQRMLFHIERSGEERSGIALYNPDRIREAELHLNLVEASGAPVASGRLALPPLGQLARFIDEGELFGAFFSSRNGSFEGSLGAVVVRGPAVSGLGLSQQRKSGALLAFPPPAGEEAPSVAEPERWTVEVVGEFPHDPNAFTQGLVWKEGRLFESTGRYGQSSLREVELATGKVLRQTDLDADYFGEGLTLFENTLVQLTWLENVAFVYELEGFRPIRELGYSGEGWGLTSDGVWLIASDGSSRLTYRNPRDLTVWKVLTVTRAGEPVSLLNELEYVDGAIYANVWQSPEILRIDPDSGAVTAVIDTAALPHRPHGSEDVLNGIAYIPERGTFLLTGKLWPKIFEVDWNRLP